MNFTIVENPYRDENSVITTRGVMTDAKIAKLNNATKRPAIVKHWEMGIPQPVVSMVSTPVVKDYSFLLNNIGIGAVNYAREADNSGAKKLRVNKIVNEKASVIYNSVDKKDVVPEKVPIEEQPKVEEVEKSNSSLEPSIVTSREELHGRHEHTGEIPVDAIRETVKNDSPSVVNASPAPITRSERNNDNLKRFETSNVVKAGDMDEYNKLLHGKEESDNDISRQLQGARDQLFKEEEKNRKVSEQLIAATKELEALKEKKTQILKMQEQRTKEEIERINNSTGLIQEDTLEKTNNLTSIQSEIARLKAQMLAIEEENYEESRSYGRAA